MRVKFVVRHAAVVATLALAGCGGGSSSGDASDSAPASQSAFSGTAYLKLQRTYRYAAKSYGVASEAARALVDQCNSSRSQFYGLPPVAPSDAVLDGLDTQVTEQYFDTDKAVTYTTGNLLALTDFQRWLGELSAGGGNLPDVPPDCAVHALNEVKTAMLWRDGIRYDLDFKAKKAVGLHNSEQSTPQPLLTDAEMAVLAEKSIAGETCEVMPTLSAATAALVGNGDVCLWNRFPLQTYLSWPWALSRQVQVNGIQETATAIEARRTTAIDPAVFEIPSDFTVKVSP